MTYRIMHELPWITIFGDEWGDFPKIFKSDEVTSDQKKSRVTKKSLFTVTNISFYILHAILCPEHTILPNPIIDRWFRHCRWGRSILT